MAIKILDKQVTIDIRTCTNSSGLYARMIWEKLFRLTNAENFFSLDSFLCDLKAMERLINEGTIRFYWQYHESGYTNLTTYKPVERPCCQIELAHTHGLIILTPLIN